MHADLAVIALSVALSDRGPGRNFTGGRVLATASLGTSKQDLTRPSMLLK
jgi:hypothetical protein